MTNRYNPEYLFNQIVKHLAHPHITITKHDEQRAAKILMEFWDYLGEHQQDQEDENLPWVTLDDNFMFWYYLLTKFGEEWVNEIDEKNF